MMLIKSIGSVLNRYNSRIALVIVLLVLLSLSGVVTNPGNSPEISSAWADSHYGILGRIAPEINLNNWIDGDGKKTTPIRLSKYRGKVIYLYFFQDW